MEKVEEVTNKHGQKHPSHVGAFSPFETLKLLSALKPSLVSSLFSTQDSGHSQFLGRAQKDFS